MEFDYDDLANEVNELLNEFGAQHTIKRVEYTGDDYINGTIGSAITTSGTITGVKFGDTVAKQVFNITDLASGVHMIFYASAVDATFEPSKDDLIEIDGSDYLVVSTDPTNPAGIDCLYTLLIRRQ